MRTFRHAVIGLAAVCACLFPSAAPAASPVAPCRTRVNPMPAGEEHDHKDPAQHRFACRMKATHFDAFSTLVPEAAMFGEIDVKGTTGVIATAFKDAGFIVLDLTDPATPRAVSRFIGPHCDELLVDIGCGADVKLSGDGKLAFLATQAARKTDEELPAEEQLPGEAGIFLVDVSVPAAPVLASYTPVQRRGVHMMSVHRIGDAEYVFTIVLGEFPKIYKVIRSPVARLEEVATLYASGWHDYHVFSDPVARRTFLYLAGGSSGLLEIFDVTNPASPRRVGEWRPAPERRGERWYIHGTWTFRSGSRRFTAVGPELFRPGSYHGDSVGPMWLLDTTNHARPKLVGTWRNHVRRAGGHLGFSPHDFTMRGTVMALAHYHGGVWLLDWRNVIARKSSTPVEIGYYVPHSINRPFAESDPIERRSFTAYEIYRRPSVWDAVWVGNLVYASDITGGLYVLAPTAR